MKKLLFVALAAVGMTACVQNEELAVSKGNAIAFANDFIDNATKSIDGTYQNNGAGANELTKFHVYGTVQNANGLANIFNEELVSKQTSGAWAYDVNKTQYWVAGNNYSFAAVAYAGAAGVTVNKDVDTAMPVSIDYDAAAQHDLLYAEVKDINYANNVQPVMFTFAHLLAKAKFTVKNLMQNGNGNSYKVKNVKVLDAVKTATYNVGGTWTDHAGQHDVTFGHIVTVGANEYEAAKKLEMNAVGESNYERLLIPQENAPLKISIDVEYYVENKVNDADVLNDSYTKTIEVAHTLEAGRAYNFIITLGNPGEPISFDVETITDWVEEDVETTKVVSSAADLAAAIADPAVGEVILSSDIDLSSTRAAATIGLVINRDLVIDGQGHKLIHSVSGANARAINVSGAENVTFKNLVIEAAGERAINVIGNAKNVTLEHVTAVAANYTVNVAASAPEANIVISQSHLTGLNTVNIAGANAVVTINNSTIVCNDQNESEGYDAIAVNKDATNAVVTVNGGEIIVYGDSVAGAVGSDNGSIVLNGTETHGAVIDDVYYAIEYGNYYYSFNTFEAALAKANEGETIKFIRDVTVESPLKVTKSVTIDLNGKTLNAMKEGVLYLDGFNVKENAEVVITGNGTVNAAYSAIVAMKNSKVTVVSGTFNAYESEAVFVQNNASVEILGGSFKSAECTNFLLNIKDSYRATCSIVVKGGSYYGFNPENNAAEGNNTNFVAPGYKVEQNGDWYTVVAE